MLRYTVTTCGYGDSDEFSVEFDEMSQALNYANGMVLQIEHGCCDDVTITDNVSMELVFYFSKADLV